ncbi:hypothetical protein N5A93_04270 [Roseovarius sp. EGI FJ00037]|nr:hypothetical protein [Roseovarius sp. EGI FJ00037]MCZ0811437.1 hypothetical protein [Roseovarius sp. EGI FJ00037]
MTVQGRHCLRAAINNHRTTPSRHATEERTSECDLLTIGFLATSHAVHHE